MLITQKAEGKFIFSPVKKAKDEEIVFPRKCGDVHPCRAARAGHGWRLRGQDAGSRRRN